MDMDPSRVRLITVRVLQEWFGGRSERSWERTRSELVRRGILRRHGNSIFGRIVDVERFLMGGDSGVTMDVPAAAVEFATGRGR
jgi:hypothetical protein